MTKTGTEVDGRARALIRAQRRRSIAPQMEQIKAMQVYAARTFLPYSAHGLTLALAGANSSASLDPDESCTLAGCDGARFPCREVVAEVESRNPSLAAH